MDIDATQVIDDIDLNVEDESHRNAGCPVGFLKLLKQKNFEEKLFPIFEGVNKVGRDIACHVTLESKTLSKEHCCIEVFHDNHLIYDLGSSNKSRRNRTVLTPNVRYELNNNDTLTLADLKLVYIKSPAVHAVESGSDTESLPDSESMLPVSFATDRAFEPQTADDDNDDDDPSSDILQPTQHAGGHLIGSYNQMHAFVEDSLRHVTSENREKESLADETVFETPPRVLSGADLGADFIPESDSEVETDPELCVQAKTLEYNDADVEEEEVKSRAVASDEPTQTYSMDFVDETAAVEGSGSQPKLTSFPAETLVLSDADADGAQVVSASTQRSDSDNAPTQVFSQFPVEILGSSTAFPMTLGDGKALEKLNLDQVTQMYVEETQLYEDEAATVIKVPPPVDKPHPLKEKIVRESNGSVINFSPQSASTQVFGLDAETSFLPTLVLETSDQLNADEHSVPSPLPAFPTAAILSPSENLQVRCTEMNPRRSQVSTDDVCTQVFSGDETGQLLAEPTTADNLCTQVYEDTEWHLGGSVGAVAMSSTSADDICTQVYQDKDGHFVGSGTAAAADSSTCSDDICTQDYNTNQHPDFVSERIEPVSSSTNSCAPNPSTPNPSIPNPSTPNPSTPTCSTLHANKSSATTDAAALNEISEQGLSVKSDFFQTQIYQSESITEEPGTISNMMSESGVTTLDGKTVEDRDSDNTDELATQSFDIPHVEKKSRGKKGKEAAKLEEKSSEVSETQPATMKSTDQKQGRNSRLSSRRTSLMQSTDQAINPGEEGTKGRHSSSDSNQPCSISSVKKKNKKPEEDVSERENTARQSRESEKEKKTNSKVSDDSGKSHEVRSEKREMESSSKASGRRISMRQNKGKRPEDTEFQKPSEEKRKNKKGSKRQTEDLEPTGIENPSKKICNDLEEAPPISKSSSEGLDSQSSRCTRDSEILDSSQLSDDDLPSLSSLIALNRIQDTSTGIILPKGHEPILAMIPENENVKPASELESEEAQIEEKDVTEDEIIKKRSWIKKQTHLESKRNPRAETNMLSEEGSPLEERNDPFADEIMIKELTGRKKMNLGSKKNQRTEEKVHSEEEGNVLMKDETVESGNKKKLSLGSKKNKGTDETMKMPAEDYSVVERKKNDCSDESKSCESVSERDLSTGTVELKARQTKSRRGTGQKQMSSDPVTENSAEENDKSSGHQRGKGVKKQVTQKSFGKKREEIFSEVIEIPVRSEETGSSVHSHESSDAATLTKGSSSKHSGELEVESDPASSSDHSGKGRRQGRSAVTTKANEVAGLSQRKNHKTLAEKIDASDENLVNNDTGIKLRTSGSTLASDVSVVKESTETVPERLNLRKKSRRTLVAEFEDDLMSKKSTEDLPKAELLQPSSDIEIEFAQLAGDGETKRITKGRKRTPTESEVSGLSLKKKTKTSVATVYSEKVEDKKVSDSETKLLTSAKKSRQTRASDLDDKVVMESSKEGETKTVAGKKSTRFGAGDVLDAEKTTKVKSSVVRKSRLHLLPENDDKVMKNSSDSELSSLDKRAGKMSETEDADEKEDKPESKLSTKTKRRTLAAEKNAREETGSRRGKKTEPRVEEELPSERCDVAQDVALRKEGSQNLTTSEGDVSNNKAQGNVEVEASEQMLQGAGRKGKKDIASNETDQKDDDKEKTDAGIDSKRSRKSRKPVTEEDSRSTEASSHPNPDERIKTPDLAKGARRRTKSEVEPAIKPRVMFTGVVDENGQKTVKSLGGEMVESIYDCTHLVTDQVRRTVKFLCGVARGLPIVSPLWLEASRSAGRFLDPSEYLVRDIKNEKKFNFSLEWTLGEAAKRPLMLGLSVHVTENVRPDPEQMKDIIQCAGGKFVPELPRSFEDSLMIVTCDGKDLESCRRLEELGIPLVSSEYIMMGILQQKLDANLFRLTTKKTPETLKRNMPEMSAGSRKKQKK